MKRFQGRDIRDAVNPCRSEMTLERTHHRFGFLVEYSIYINTITVERQKALYRLDGLAPIPLLQEPSTAGPRRIDPVADAGLTK